MSAARALDALTTRLAHVRGGLDAVVRLLDAKPGQDTHHVRAVAALALAEAEGAHRLAAVLLDRLDAATAEAAPAPGAAEADA